MPLFSVRRADIEAFARELEGRGRDPGAATRRLSTIAGFYRYAVEEELLDHSPAAHVRRPRVDYESHATALDRNEVGAFLVAAGLGEATEHVLISLLALNWLRVSEATDADIEHLTFRDGINAGAIRLNVAAGSADVFWAVGIAVSLVAGDDCAGPEPLDRVQRVEPFLPAASFGLDEVQVHLSVHGVACHDQAS